MFNSGTCKEDESKSFLRKFLFIAILVTFGIKSQGQETASPSLQKAQFIINIISPSFSYEARLGRKTSLALKAGVGFGVTYDSYDGGQIDGDFWPYLMADYRYYYNLDKRVIKGRSTSHNSGNFVALSAWYSNQIPNPLSIGKEYAWSAGPVWGIQRTYWNRVNLKLAFGMGVVKREGENIIPWPMIDYSLGIRLGI
ncbi:hypothetical protein SAMN05216436_1254 [bacterium A37T11]|nr:hypothetical protein SAMN05216436_1254 [bacterium A37T11]